jgi:hypothetical protein
MSSQPRPEGEGTGRRMYRLTAGYQRSISAPDTH